MPRLARCFVVSLFLVSVAAAGAFAQPSRLTGFGLLRLEPSE